MTLFWLDNQRDIRLSYDELTNILTEREERHPVVYADDPSKVLIEILLAILGDRELTLLDPEFSEETLSSLGYEYDIGKKTEKSPDIHVNNPKELVSRIENANEDWMLTLHTSGTTGTPSKVDLNLKILTRSIRKDKRYKDHVWGFAYNPTHFAGLQVFFQAVLNKNPMVYIFECSPEQISNLVDQHGVTHISATPTFYRLRLQQLPGSYETVRRLSSGGEKFEPSLQEALHESFPNAKFRNIYAITEAGSLLESDGEVFQIPEEYTDHLRISEDCELLIHRSLLGQSVLNDTDGEWFHTGDVVEFVDNDRFRFVGRKSDFVNIGGYRVNPHEVEERINSVEGIEAAVVKARESSVTGNVLVAEVQINENMKSEVAKDRIKTTINNLKKWKQPRMIDVVDSIDQSRSGKRVRNKEKSW
jgi:acyl-coenzyme A synthetase/AMP-(fatty) acid ligase